MSGEQRIEVVLGRAQDRGFIGPGPLDRHLAQSAAFARLVGDDPAEVVDLGSGGGLPALPVALARPTTSWRLVEARARRADFLRQAVLDLGLADRVAVLHERAEDVGRAQRGSSDLVLARLFGPPAVVAECGAPLLRVGGRLIVSDPPEGSAERWPAGPLGRLGLVVEESPEVAGYHFTVLRQVAPAPGRYPRRPGIPERKPLF
jgi:16S rRNA (guanine527-N7)-methyltransferase